MSFLSIFHGSLNVPIEHHPTIRYMMVYGLFHGYYKVMSNIPKSWDIYQPLFFQGNKEFWSKWVPRRVKHNLFVLSLWVCVWLLGTWPLGRPLSEGWRFMSQAQGLRELVSAHDVMDYTSGELTFCYGKSPFLMGKSTINGHFPLLC